MEESPDGVYRGDGGRQRGVRAESGGGAPGQARVCGRGPALFGTELL